MSFKFEYCHSFLARGYEYIESSYLGCPIAQAVFQEIPKLPNTLLAQIYQFTRKIQIERIYYSPGLVHHTHV